MTNTLLRAAVVSCVCSGLWGQGASIPLPGEEPDVMNTATNHAKDPVGFELPDKSQPDDSVYSEDVVSAIRARWYSLLSELRQASYDQQGVVVVEFKVKKDGSLGKLAIAERAGEERLDSAALNAIRNASPFKPLPANFKSKTLGFRVHLGYNQPIPGNPCPTTFPGVYRVRDGTTVPRALYTPDPEFSEDARKSKYQGTAVLGLTVGGDGLPYDVCVLNALGHGLDEKSIEAVKQWKFQPAVKDGRTVPVRLSVETEFRLY